MIDDIDEKQEPVERWISFYLGEERYAVEVKKVREILRIHNIVPVPGAADYVLGITNIRGSVVTVIDGRSRMHLTQKKQDKLSRVVIIEYYNEFIGIVVDSVADVIDLPASAIDINPKINSHEGEKYIRGVVSSQSGLIIILDIERFLGCEQNTALAMGF